MQIVIKISEDSYKATCRGSMLPPDVENVVNAIRNGTPLPKGHGRLIDADALKETFIESNIYLKGNEKGFWCFTGKEIKNAPTIIEADKAEGANE